MAKEIKVALVLDSRGFTQGIRAAREELGQFEERGKSAGISVGNALAAIGGAAVIGGIVSLADTFQNLQNKLAAVTGSQASAQVAFENIRTIAEATRSPIAEIGDLYSKLSIATQDAGVSATEVAQMTTTFAQALQLSGASAQSAQSAILQFGQAMASGRLQGDEFRSLMENSPVFMRKLSEALERPVGELKELASQGVITAEIIRLAMAEMAPEVESEFDRMQTTLGQSFTLIQNNFMEMMANVEASTGIFAGIANIIKVLSENTKIFAAVAAIAFGAAIGRLIYGIVTAMVALRTAIAGATVAQATLLALGGPAGLAALAAGVVAAGAAYLALSSIMDDVAAESADAARRTEAEIAAKAELARANQGAAAAELARMEGIKTSEKAAAEASRKAASAAAAAARKEQAAQQARANTAASNAQRIRDNIAELGVETTQLAKRLALDIQLVGVSDALAESKNKIFEIDTARDKLIADIQAKELSTDPAENARLQATAIAEVNRQYDDQISQLGKLIDKRIALINLDTERGATAALFNSLEDARMTAARIQNLTEAFEYEKEFNLASEAATARAASLKATYIENERRDRAIATEEQLRELDRLKAAEFARIDSDLRNKIAASKTTRDLNKLEFEAARTFAVGMAQASNDAMLRLTDNAQIARDMFNMTMNGFSNAILKFVETGKLSFKDLFKSLMAELIKLQAQKLFMQLFGGDGILGSLLPGVFGKKAVGGPVMAGTPYIVGERGPELFVPSGPGTVMANGRFGGGGGVTQITYNINAVDALSFKQLVARDPEFIYSVSQAGARRLPR